MRIQHAMCLVLATACTNNPVDSSIKLPPHGGTREAAPQSGKLGTQAFQFAPGSFHLTAQTVPGSASFTAAPMSDPNGPPPVSYGAGDYNVTLSGTTYSGTSQTLAGVLGDPNFGDYLVLGGFREYTDANQQDRVDEIVVVVDKADFAVGATVAFDGQDRLALFASGPATADQPDVMGAAVTGSITFTAGSLDANGSVTATLQGDFAPADWGNPPLPTGSITAGTYTLAIQGPAEAFCDGSLAGHEADFASVTAADLALAGGSVAVATPSPTAYTIDGAAIASAYATTPLELDPAGSGLYAAFTTQSGSGPDSTQMIGKYFVVDASSATTSLVYAGAGAGYATADGSGTCTVAFGATLTP